MSAKAGKNSKVTEFFPFVAPRATIDLTVEDRLKGRAFQARMQKHLLDVAGKTIDAQGRKIDQLEQEREAYQDAVMSEREAMQFLRDKDHQEEEEARQAAAARSEQCDSMREELEELRKEVVGLREEYMMKLTEIENLQDEIKKVRTDRDYWQGEAMRLGDKQENVYRLKLAHEDELGEKDKQVASLRAQIATLQAELDASRSREHAEHEQYIEVASAFDQLRSFMMEDVLGTFERFPAEIADLAKEFNQRVANWQI